jgi:predicted Ser/Thr protein kinase
MPGEAVIEQGASFDGYRVERVLGRGGMGVVYEAVQSSLERRVALKILRPDLAHDPAFAERFRREARLQASLEHPHVVEVYEVGESPHGLFLAMRLISGPTLAELLREGGLDASRALDLLAQAADALDAAHTAGLVHRDVKPQNVLVGEGDHAFLADFGLSRPGTDTITASRPTLGTVAYLAPEVVRGESPTPASDRYAFAATLFHCLAGDVVFPRGSDAAALFAHASEEPPRISQRRPELPAALDGVFADGLAKDPAQRPASARELVAQVRQVLGERALFALGPPEVASRTGPRPPDAPIAAPPARWRPLAALAGVAVVAAALGAGAVALIGREADRVEEEAPVPAVAAGATALGSPLGRPDRSVGCSGRAPRPASVPCSIVQAGLPGAQLLAPADGAIVGWSVRGARGDLALDVIRPRGEETVRVARSQWEYAGNAAPHRFATSLAVERGDLIGVELGPGAAIGIRESEGATTRRWMSPIGGFYGSPDRGAGTGLDHEVLVRADFVAGGKVESPPQLTGARAARAADGRVRDRVRVTISEPRATVTALLVEVGDRVALDVVYEGRRAARTYLPGLIPGGEPANLKAYVYEGEPVAEVGVWWVNPNSGRLIFHFANVSTRRIHYLG